MSGKTSSTQQSEVDKIPNRVTLHWYPFTERILKNESALSCNCNDKSLFCDGFCMWCHDWVRTYNPLPKNPPLLKYGNFTCDISPECWHSLSDKQKYELIELKFDEMRMMYGLKGHKGRTGK